MPRQPTDEELQQWQAETRQAKPLGKELKQRKEKRVQPEKAMPDPQPPPAPSPAGLPISLPPLISNAFAGIDASTVRRLKRGQMEIERKIDLHGHTQAEALAVLTAQLAAARQRGERLALVITGKGRSSAGVLKTQLPRWLNLPDLRSHVLAFAPARPEHGGSGAFYVLLKKGNRQ